MESFKTFGVSLATISGLLRIGSERVPGWIAPVVNHGDEGRVEAEWWNGPKTLIVSADGERLFAYRVHHSEDDRGADLLAEDQDDLTTETFVEWCGWLCT